MKTLQDFVSENLVMEAAAKNAHLPRKGSTIYPKSWRQCRRTGYCY